MVKIKKSISAAAMMMTALIGCGLLFFSCNDNPPAGKGVFIPETIDTSALSQVKHFISLSDIKQFRAAFNTERDSLSLRRPDLFITESEGFNKPALLEILKDPKCVGMRIYYGVAKGDKKKELRLILVGIDAQGKDLYITGGSALAAGVTQNLGGLEYGQCCQGEPLR